MALILADRVKESTTTTGTSDFALGGAMTGFQTFASAVGANNSTYYAVADGADWEVGLGTLSSNGLTLARTTVLQSSNSDTKVSFASGTKHLFVTYPADKAVSDITSTDASIVVSRTGSIIDLAVSEASPASTLLTAVRNTTGATLTKGTAVYISGATGQKSIVSKALATGDATSAQTLGLITSDLANNSNGYVTVIGLISNIDTSAYADGAQLYLSPTTAGTLTATKPYAPQHLVYLAIVEYAHPTQGKLFVKVQNGYEMDELHNVSAQSPTTGQTLVYNSSTSLWEKNTVSLTVGVNGTLPIANGGSGTTTAQGAMNAFAGAVTSGSYLRGNGTDVVMSAIQVADVPTLNQNTTGAASNVTGIVAVANGGTGTATPALVAGTNITITGSFPNQTINSTASGSGTVTSVAATVPSFLSVSGSPITTSGTLAFSLASTPTNGQLLIGNGTDFSYSTLTAGSNITITNSSGGITIASTGGGSSSPIPKLQSWSIGAM